MNSRRLNRRILIVGEGQTEYLYFVALRREFQQALRETQTRLEIRFFRKNGGIRRLSTCLASRSEPLPRGEGKAKAHLR
jgi:hypothetical protein